MKVEAVGQSEVVRAAANLRPGGELGKEDSPVCAFPPRVSANRKGK